MKTPWLYLVVGAVWSFVWAGCASVGDSSGIVPVMGMGEEKKKQPARQDSLARAKAAPARTPTTASATVQPAAASPDSSDALGQTLLFLPFKDESKYKGPWNIYVDMARGLGDSLKYNDFFRVIPVDSVLADLQKRELQGRIDPEKALRLGQRLGADYVIFGRIDELSMKRFRATVPLGGYRSYEGIASVALQLLKVIDGQPAGEVLGNGSEPSKNYGITNPAAYLPFEKEYFLLGEMAWGSDEFYGTLLGKAIGACLANLATELAVAIQPPPELKSSEPKIIAIDPDHVYINIGLAEGVTNGVKFGVWDLGRELVDPESGVVLGQALPRRVGVVQVVQVLNEHLSDVRILEGAEDIERGYRLRAE
ncbi:MAG: hypothetical protein GKR89_21195 [Candidatus Latescibacteria bacterium]|nr:hypothetical protein [Candidatus Latescibacterota bacterium]